MRTDTDCEPKITETEDPGRENQVLTIPEYFWNSLRETPSRSMAHADDRSPSKCGSPLPPSLMGFLQEVDLTLVVSGESLQYA